MLPLLELLKHHVLAQLQEQRLLKVTQNPAEGLSVVNGLWKTLHKECHFILKTDVHTEIYLPNIFEHVQHLRRKMGGCHIKLCKVSF